MSLCVLAAALPLAAAAQEARSTKWVNLRAGPARDYPLVHALGPGTLLRREWPNLWASPMRAGEPSEVAQIACLADASA